MKKLCAPYIACLLPLLPPFFLALFSSSFPMGATTTTNHDQNDKSLPRTSTTSLQLLFVYPSYSYDQHQRNEEMKKQSVACGLLRMLLALLPFLPSFLRHFPWDATATTPTRDQSDKVHWNIWGRPQATKFMAVPFVHPRCSCSSKEMKK